MHTSPLYMTNGVSHCNAFSISSWVMQQTFHCLFIIHPHSAHSSLANENTWLARPAERREGEPLWSTRLIFGLGIRASREHDSRRLCCSETRNPSLVLPPHVGSATCLYNYTMGIHRAKWEKSGEAMINLAGDFSCGAHIATGKQI